VTHFSVRAKAGLLFILQPFLRTVRLRSDVQDGGAIQEDEINEIRGGGARL